MNESDHISKLLYCASLYMHNSRIVNNVSSFCGLEKMISLKKILWTLRSKDLKQYTELDKWF